MGPSRKRPRTKASSVGDTKGTKSTDEDTSLKVADSQATLFDQSQNSSRPSVNEDAITNLKNLKPEASSVKQLNPKASWYGTWPRKSGASTQIAKETVSADASNNGPSSSNFERLESKKSAANLGRPPSMYLGKSKETLDITMGGTSDNDSARNIEEVPKSVDKVNTHKEPQDDLSNETTAKPSEKHSPEHGDPIRPRTASTWLGWLGRPTTQPASQIEISHDTVKDLEVVPAKNSEVLEQDGTAPVAVTADAKSDPSSASTSWFGLWSTAAPSTKDPPKEQIPIKIVHGEEDTVMEDTDLSKVSEPVTGSSWAFWSSEPSKKIGHTTAKSDEPGQLAVTGETSQDHPEPAKAINVKENKKATSSKRGRPRSTDMDEPSNISRPLDPGSTKATPSQSPAPAKSLPPNLLLPSVKSTYRLVENPSILQQIARLLRHGHQQPVKHVSLVKEVPKIKKALAIGIHGLFPAPLLRTVIGQPTGTSIKFANHAAEAIRRWTDAHGSVECEIEKVALEGEGKIADRVDNLWKLLLNWIDHVRKADFIMIACHSQGVPVAVMLVAKLVEFGVVSTGRVGICAMAGVSLGPFADYKSRLFSGSAGELFEFANPESTVSKRYEDSLRIALKYGVRITYCGSIDDQLVSMESSVFSIVSHPYIFRAVFVDGRIHAPDFLSHLVGFALKLRNLGVSDHGLIRELSAPLAGSLYTGEGHSRLYDEGNVYDLATEFALETTSVGDIPIAITKYEIPSNANPYVLPWIMRGLLEEDFVKTELDTETTELLKQFDDWKPATKVLKDVKYRLEAVRSKL